MNGYLLGVASVCVGVGILAVVKPEWLNRAVGAILLAGAAIAGAFGIGPEVIPQ